MFPGVLRPPKRNLSLTEAKLCKVALGCLLDHKDVRTEQKYKKSLTLFNFFLNSIVSNLRTRLSHT